MICAPQDGQRERGATRLKASFRESPARFSAVPHVGLLAPVALHHDRQPIDDDVQEAADDQPMNAKTTRDEQWRAAATAARQSTRRRRLDPDQKRRPECPPNAVYCGACAAEDRRSQPPLDDGTHLEDRQVHGDDQAADEHAEDRHDHRLEQAATGCRPRCRRLLRRSRRPWRDISSSEPDSSPTAIIWMTMFGNRSVFSIACCRR